MFLSDFILTVFKTNDSRQTAITQTLVQLWPGSYCAILGRPRWKMTNRVNIFDRGSSKTAIVMVLQPKIDCNNSFRNLGRLSHSVTASMMYDYWPTNRNRAGYDATVRTTRALNPNKHFVMWGIPHPQISSPPLLLDFFKHINSTIAKASFLLSFIVLSPQQ